MNAHARPSSSLLAQCPSWRRKYWDIRRARASSRNAWFARNCMFSAPSLRIQMEGDHNRAVPPVRTGTHSRRPSCTTPSVIVFAADAPRAVGSPSTLRSRSPRSPHGPLLRRRRAYQRVNPMVLRRSHGSSQAAQCDASERKRLRLTTAPCRSIHSPDATWRATTSIVMR